MGDLPTAANDAARPACITCNGFMQAACALCRATGEGRRRTTAVPLAVDVILVPAALAATTPAYWKMTEEPAGMGFRVMPAMSLGESGFALGLPEVPKVRDVTPADSVTCTDALDAVLQGAGAADGAWHTAPAFRALHWRPRDGVWQESSTVGGW